jgi:galactonate dehydratase
MKIRELKTFVVGNPPPTWGGRYFIFVKLTTDTGIEGIGEVYGASFGPHAMVRLVEDVFAHHVLDADPFQIETLWRNVYGRGYSQRPDITLMGVLSGIEMALWDIVGKALDKPVHALLGGKVRERLRSYTYLYPSETEGDAYAKAAVYDDPDTAAERAAEYVAMGFSAPKPICCSARMASSPPRARSVWRGGWNSSIRCGSRSRCRRKNPRRWPSWRARPRSRLRPASG